MNETFQTHCAEDTIALGERLSALLPESGLVLLIGNLGAGKTTLTKGIAQARGAVRAEDVSSPTFTLIHEYGEPALVYHIDLYRLENASEVASLGLDEILNRDALVVIEWGERFPELWPEERTEVRIQIVDEEERVISVRSFPLSLHTSPQCGDESSQSL
jgi:tRNA threonylcarbamoyladenosine biosynthesis protein TsaE